jgi:hypothetical protein
MHEKCKNKRKFEIDKTPFKANTGITPKYEDVKGRKERRS